MRNKFVSRCLVVVRLVAVVLVLCCAAALMAQTNTGSITGTVTDPQGAVVSGASVSLVSETTGAERALTTDERGTFTFNAVPSGTYRLKVENSGFKKYERVGIVLDPNGRLAVGDIRLSLGMSTESISVVAEGTAVQTASSERSGIVTSQQVADLTIVSRDFSVLGSLQPGVVYNGAAETQSFSQSAKYNVNGGRTTQNSITIDGIPVENSNVGGTNTFISLDAVSQVKIQTSNFQAEFGRKPAGEFQAVTKSGTTAYHGGAYWYQRNEAFNASPYSNDIINAKKLFPPYRFITAGATLGGPVYIPKILEQKGQKKLFFFFLWEEQRESRPQDARFVTVPTLLERSGDFSQSVSTSFPAPGQQQVFDPTTGKQFPGNKIPGNRINAIGQAFLNQFPLPNAFGSFNGKTYNYTVQESLQVPKNTQTARVDYNLTPKTSIYGVFNHWYDDERGWAVPAGNANWGWLPSEYNPVSKTGTLSATHIFSPTLILELTQGYSDWSEGNHPSQALLDMRSRVAQKVAIPQLFPANNPLNIMPQATFGGIDNAANPTITSRYPISGTEDVNITTASLTNVRGRHTLKAGLFYEHWYEFKAPNGNFTGTYDFSGNNQTSTFTTALGNTQNAWANTLLGNFFQYTESTTRPPTLGRYNGIEWFAQDNFKVNSRLTLDLGVRFGYSQPFHQPDAKEAGFNPDLWDPSKAVTLYTAATAPVKTALGAIVPGKGDPLNGTINRATNPNYPEGLRTSGGVTAGPRLGFSWDPFGHGSTAVRGGFGMFYDIRERDNFQFNTFKNPPLQQNPIIYFGNFGTLASGASYLFPTATSGFQKDRKKPYVMDYSLGIQHEIGFKTVVDVSYAGNAGRHLWWERNLNSIPAGTVNPFTSSLPDQFYRPYAGYLNIIANEFAGTSNYNSLQVSANRRFSKSVVFGGAYTWSHALGYADDETQSVINVPGYSPRQFNYGNLGFDHRHIFKGSWTWDAPRASSVWDNGFVRTLLDNWKFSGIMTYQAGAPLGVNLGTITAINPTTGKSQNFSASQWSGSPTDGARVQVVSYNGGRDMVLSVPRQGTLGNASKFIFAGPPINNWDMALAKQFALGERVKMQFTAQTYNTFNHPQFTGVDQTANFTVDAAGNATQTNKTFLRNNVAGAMRRLQLGLRFSF